MSSEITRSVLIDAPASVIFEALTDEDELVRWMARSARMDARVGGEYEFRFYRAEKQAETTAKGRIVELVPNRKLAYTFASNQDGADTPPSLLTWTLDEGPDGKTLVTLVHSGIDAVSCLRRSLGWGYYLDQLAVNCSRMQVQEPMRFGKR